MTGLRKRRPRKAKEGLRLGGATPRVPIVGTLERYGSFELNE